MDEVEGEKVTENVEGKVSEETSQKEINYKEVVEGNAASEQEASTGEATAAEVADTDGNG